MVVSSLASDVYGVAALDVGLWMRRCKHLSGPPTIGFRGQDVGLGFRV